MNIHEYDSNFIRQANLCEAVMMRVVELEEESKRLAEVAKKLRAAVLANT